MFKKKTQKLRLGFKILIVSLRLNEMGLRSWDID